MKRLRSIAIIIGAVMVLASIYFQSMRITLSVAAGSAIVILSYELLFLVVSRALSGGKRSPAVFVAIALFKLTLLGFVLWFVVVRTPIHALAFLAGLSTIVFAICVYGIYEY